MRPLNMKRMPFLLKSDVLIGGSTSGMHALLGKYWRCTANSLDDKLVVD